MNRLNYQTSLEQLNVNAPFANDVKKAKLLLKSARMTNPNNPDIWLSAAKVEERDQNLE